jgi:hypothetical protein
MCIVVCVRVGRRDFDSANSCIANAKRAEVLLGVVLALHAGQVAGKRSGVSRREWRWQVGVRGHFGRERSGYCVVWRGCGVRHRVGNCVWSRVR